MDSAAQPMTDGPFLAETALGESPGAKCPQQRSGHTSAAVAGPPTPGSDAGEVRRAEIAANLRVLRMRIARACRAAGRDPASVTIIAVTKTRPATDVRHLAALGVTDLGENRDQEAAPKAAQCADLGLTWHFIGQLQRNKVASVARYADVVHSVDRLALVGTLARAAERAQRSLGVCCQVDLGAGSSTGRGGVRPEGLLELADAVAGQQGLRLLGIMAVAPVGEEPAAVFGRLAGLAARLTSAHPGANMVSAGMSTDFEPAIVAGSTHIRVGTALLGARPSLR